MPKFLHKMVVGIDVSADFSVVEILSPNGEIYNTYDNGYGSHTIYGPNGEITTIYGY